MIAYGHVEVAYALLKIQKSAQKPALMHGIIAPLNSRLKVAVLVIRIVEKKCDSKTKKCVSESWVVVCGGVQEGGRVYVSPDEII